MVLRMHRAAASAASAVSVIRSNSSPKPLLLLRCSKHSNASMQVTVQYGDKVLGCILAALCGDALGAAAEGWSAQQVQAKFPSGLTAYEPVRMGLGCYTDDGQMLLALAASLINQQGHCVASDAATQYALAYDPQRGYGGSAGKVLAALQARLSQTGSLPPTLGTELMAAGGSYGNGGAMRIAPLGLVYRNASLPVLEAAVREALLPTHHVHPWALEGALTQALAVMEASKLQPPQAMEEQQQQQQPQGSLAGAPAGDHCAAAAAAAGSAPYGPASSGSGSCQPPRGSSGGGPPAGALQLLHALAVHLECCSEVMSGRVEAIRRALLKLHASHGGPKHSSQSWQDFFSSPAWAFELKTSGIIAPGEQGGGFQIKATDAAAAALWACVAHWHSPRDVIVAAAHYGGDTDTIACMAGAIAGALHGSDWLPPDWLEQLEAGRRCNAANLEEFFDMPAVEATLQEQEQQHVETDMAAVSGDGGDAGAAAAAVHGPVLMHTTRDMGRDGAVLLARLLARLDFPG